MGFIAALLSLSWPTTMALNQHLSIRDKQMLLACVPRVDCPNCHVRANAFISETPANFGRLFYKCPRYSALGCQFYQWADTMEDFFTGGTPAALGGGAMVPAAAQAPVPVAAQALPLPAAQAEAAAGQRMDMDLWLIEERLARIMEELRWIEKIVCACVILMLYALFFKYAWNGV
ncbi:hypothetical protein ACP4OV_027339 [Aristida adscensionis]